MSNASQPSEQERRKFTTVVPTCEQGIELILRHLGPTTLVAIIPDVGRTAALWVEESNADVVQWAKERNQAGWNVYFTANLPQPQLNKKPRKAEIGDIRCLYADIDAKAGRGMEECLAAIERLSLPPSFVIMTGGGYQPIWLLDQPLPASPESTQWAEAAGRTIAELTQGDSVENIDRILRMPGTINYPNAIKRNAGRTPCMASIMVRQ